MSQLADFLQAARYRRSVERLRPSKLAAIVVPLSDRSGFTPDERLSLRHLDRYLGDYDRYFIAPRGLAVEHPGFAVKRFDPAYFGSALAHRRLVFSPRFYDAFRDYRFILIYHLDALVFSDQLVRWCERGYDYVGAPWVKHEDAPYAGQAPYEGKVGNGGFSLRNVKSFLGLLVSGRQAIDPAAHVLPVGQPSSPRKRIAHAGKRLLLRAPLVNNIRWELERLPYESEERFLANRATHFSPEFRIAPLEVALEFAFECVPRHCFELNHRRLPFGCHAWRKYDPAFWEPYLLGA